MTDTIAIPNYDETVEDLNKPAIGEGTYLAVVTGAETHMSAATPGNQSIKWSLSINTSEYTDEWDVSGRVFEFFPGYFTPLGRIVTDDEGNESLEINKRGYGITDRMARAVNAISPEGVIDLRSAIGRLVLVTVKHERDNRQSEEDIATEGIRWQARIQRVAPYRNDAGEVAPTLEGFAVSDPAEEAGDGDVEF